MREVVRQAQQPQVDEVEVRVGEHAAEARLAKGGGVVGGPRIMALRTCWASMAWFSLVVSTLCIIVLKASALTVEKLAAKFFFQTIYKTVISLGIKKLPRPRAIMRTIQTIVLFIQCRFALVKRPKRQLQLTLLQTKLTVLA